MKSSEADVVLKGSTRLFLTKILKEIEISPVDALKEALRPKYESFRFGSYDPSFLTSIFEDRIELTFDGVVIKTSNVLHLKNVRISTKLSFAANWEIVE